MMMMMMMMIRLVVVVVVAAEMVVKMDAGLEACFKPWGRFCWDKFHDWTGPAESLGWLSAVLEPHQVQVQVNIRLG